MAEPRAQACFCLSKAKHDGRHGIGADTGIAMLRAELEGLKSGPLRKRAKAAGAAAEAVEDAFDAEDSKSAMIELILAHDAGGKDPTASLRAELEGLKFSTLAERANAAGATDQELEEVDDADEPKEAIVALVLAREARKSGALAHELSQMRITSLISRATAAGVSEEQIDEAEDADDYKAALIELILANDDCQAALRAELSGMKLAKLIKRAAAAGATRDELDAAEDQDDHKSAVIGLILDKEAADQPAETTAHAQVPAQHVGPLRSELSGIRLTALRTRAESEGVDADLVEDALDTDDPKQRMIELLVQHQASVEEQGSGLRTELEGLKPSALKKRARAAGVAEAEITEARDADDPKETLIALVIKNETPSVNRIAALRAELSSLKVSALAERASAAGVTEEEIEEAEDEQDPKTAMVDLILAQEKPPQAASRPAKPAAREPAKPEPEPASADVPVQQTDHPVYQALESHQLQLVFDQLLQLGVKRVEDLEHITESDVDEMSMNKFDRAKFVSAFLPSKAAARPPAPAPAPQPEPEPAAEPEPVPEKTDHSAHPVYRTLESHSLEHLFDKLQQMGVRRVEDLEQLTQADLGELKVTKFDRAKFMATFITQTPHHGTPSASTDGSAGQAAASAGIRFEGGKHVMFSYQWDCQSEVQSVREHFAKLGIPTWMDTDGGMQVDIYDSMAQGVSNAAVVVSFMTQRYQDSENCKLELKYAKQKKIPIIPALMQGNGWRASEWLGVITAGALWTPLYDASTMQQNLQSLIDQIKMAVPTTIVTTETKPARTLSVKPAGESEHVLALRSELDGLRSELAKAVTQSATGDESTAGTSRSLAPLPAEVPPLSLNLHPTPDMHKLKGMLLSSGDGDSTMSVTSEKSKVGALGMGGIGKTVTGSWLARDEDIRRHFEIIVWVTLGQTPDLARMQSLIHLQVTGEELSSDTSTEQAKELITVAMRDKCVLLILDDVWEEPHEAALNFVDTSTASKTLVTTRIRGLGGGSQLELGLPSEAESVQLLLSSAGLAHLSPAPAEASEVVQICGRLPLAVDLAGKMLRDLGLGGADWAGIPKLLQQEMRSSADGDETSVEYRVISASLGAIPLRDRADAKRVFSVFALVAEDTHVPLSAFRILLSAVTGEEELVPELQLRKWLQLLINRSIVLGTWERPQLHDIVREYVISLHTPEELRKLQQQVVDAFAEHRPALRTTTVDELCELRAWQRQDGVDCAIYVNNEIEHHIRSALDLSADAWHSCAERWLGHYPWGRDEGEQDDVVSATGFVLGQTRLLELMDGAGDHEWLKLIAFIAWENETIRVEGFGAFNDKRYTAVLEPGWGIKGKCLFEDQRPAKLTVKQYEHWVLRFCVFCFDAVRQYSVDGLLELAPFFERKHLERFPERTLQLLETTDVGRAHPSDPADLRPKTLHAQLLDDGDADAVDPPQLQKWRRNLQNALKESRLGPGRGTVPQSLALLLGGGDWFEQSLSIAMMRLPEWSWDLIDRIDVVEVMQAYDLETDSTASGDRGSASLMSFGIGFLSALRGDLGAAHRAFDIQFDVLSRMIADIDGSKSVAYTGRLVNAVFFYLPWMLHKIGRSEEAARFMADVGLTWVAADATVDRQQLTEPSIIKRGETKKAIGMRNTSAEDWSWTAKLQFVLCTTWREVPSADVVAALPSPDVLESYVLDLTIWPKRARRLREGVGSLLLLAAEVCEKLERPADALLYLEKALRPSSNDTTTDMRPTVLAPGHALRGRMLAAQGKKADAEAAFEEAIEISHRTGLRLLEMFALRDLKKHVLDGDGRGEEGIRRLKAVLSEMKGPPAELTKLLGEGLDAEAILRS